MTNEQDPHGLSANTPGAKLDAGKMRPWLCIAGFAHALNAVADVTTKGAVKYTPNGWAAVIDGPERYMEAFARHMMALGRGEEIDADTGALHKAQMIWNLLASLELELREANKFFGLNAKSAPKRDGSILFVHEDGIPRKMTDEERKQSISAQSRPNDSSLFQERVQR